MGMLGTLAKVAIGIAVAKGVGSMLNKGKTNGGVLGGGTSGAGQQAPAGRQGGGLEDLLGDMLSGGRRTGQGQTGGGLGDLLEQLGGGLAPSGGSSGGGLGDLIGGLAGGQTRGGGQIGEIFGDFLSQQQGGGQEQGGSFGEIFNDSLARGGQPEVQPSREQEAAAALMLRAMLQAAKADGDIDADEERKLLDSLEDVSAEEREFVNQELRRPVDAGGLAREVPRGMEQQVYLMSIMGIDLDNRKEAEYLHELAGHLDIDRDGVNAIHDHLGVPRLYS